VGYKDGAPMALGAAGIQTEELRTEEFYIHLSLFLCRIRLLGWFYFVWFVYFAVKKSLCSLCSLRLKQFPYFVWEVKLAPNLTSPPQGKEPLPRLLLFRQRVRPIPPRIFSKTPGPSKTISGWLKTSLRRCVFAPLR
jgi:hypothetical protein